MPRTSNKADLIMDYVNQFIQENGSAAYSRNNKELMIGRQRRELMQDICKLQDFLQGL